MPVQSKTTLQPAGASWRSWRRARDGSQIELEISVGWTGTHIESVSHKPVEIHRLKATTVDDEDRFTLSGKMMRKVSFEFG